jgi:hypothetical protein
MAGVGQQFAHHHLRVRPDIAFGVIPAPSYKQLLAGAKRLVLTVLS